MKYNFIAIEGNIGAGKSSLAEKIATSHQAMLIKEGFEETRFCPNFIKTLRNTLSPWSSRFWPSATTS